MTRPCSVCGLLTNGLMYHQHERRHQYVAPSSEGEPRTAEVHVAEGRDDLPKPDSRMCVLTSEQAALEYARGQHAERRRTMQIIGILRDADGLRGHDNLLDRLVMMIASEPLPDVRAASSDYRWHFCEPCGVLRRNDHSHE